MSEGSRHWDRHETSKRVKIETIVISQWLLIFDRVPLACEWKAWQNSNLAVAEEFASAVEREVTHAIKRRFQTADENNEIFDVRFDALDGYCTFNIVHFNPSIHPSITDTVFN